MAQGLAYATRLFPEEIALWGLDGALGPVPWQDERFQRGIRCRRSPPLAAPVEGPAAIFLEME